MTEIEAEHLNAAWDRDGINVGDILVYPLGEEQIVAKVGDKYIVTKDITPWYRRVYNWSRRLFI